MTAPTTDTRSPRTTTGTVVRILAGDVRRGDVVVFKDGTPRLVHERTRRGADVTLTFRGDYTRITVPVTHPTTVLDEQACDCNGTGAYGARRHFACDGKGYQTRADSLRNNAYWNANGGRARA